MKHFRSIIYRRCGEFFEFYHLQMPPAPGWFAKCLKLNPRILFSIFAIGVVASVEAAQSPSPKLNDVGSARPVVHFIQVERLADSIWHAEGGLKTKHPYGILKKYKVTTPRQACINTINHALRDYKGSDAKEFIKFLGGRYCPVGAENDPKGLNKNWIGNVTKIYFEGTK